MFISWRLLQIGAFSAMLAACSTPAAERPGTGSSSQLPQPSMPAVSGPAALPTHTGESAVLSPDGRLRPEVQAFASELAATRGLQPAAVNSLLATAQYNERVAKLIAPQVATGRKIVRSWTVYRARVVEPVRIRWGVDFREANRDVLNRAAQRYGVPDTIIAAIIGVETNYARNMGSFRVMDSLTTLAFDYPDTSRPERETMFRNQLADFIELTLQGKLDPETEGSFAGAIGMSQFMPGSIKLYAVDGDQDGHIDLAHSIEDAVMSVGNFLSEHGWQRGLPVFAPVALPANPAALVDGGLVPKQDWTRIEAAGGRLMPGARDTGWMARPLGVIDLPDEARGTAQYRTATENFFALTQYNRSYFYAASVADLASALEQP